MRTIPLTSIPCSPPRLRANPSSSPLQSSSVPLFSPPCETHPRSNSGFTLAEMLVAISVLALLAAFMGQMLNSSSALVATNDKHMDADNQARGTLDRMAVDMGQIVKRADVDYIFQKNPTSGSTYGNDQLAFFSQVPGYLGSSPAPSPATPSPVSLVTYRVNTTSMALERMGKGLIWNGATGVNTPLIFLPQTIALTWPAAASSTATDANYETIAPGVFRFEYYFLLKGQLLNGAAQPALLSAVPYDTRMGHNSITGTGLSDVAAIGVAIAVVDPASRNLVSNAQLSALAKTMNDFPTTGTPLPGQMETQWTSAIAASSLPHVVSSAIRVYGRMLYLSPSIQ